MTEKKVVMPESTISPEMIETMRAKLGLKLRVDDSTHNEYATRLAILKFAEGIGDSNPLWNATEIARSSEFLMTFFVA